jgi:inorganic pyrophosphatase
MKVFIQNEAGSDIKHSHDEKTLEPKWKTRFSRAYPLPYGFVLNTTADDGLNVDCFVITNQPLTTGQIVDCDPIGLMEQIEDGKTDHNVIAVVQGEGDGFDENTKRILTDSASHVFDHLPFTIAPSLV